MTGVVTFQYNASYGANRTIQQGAQTMQFPGQWGFQSLQQANLWTTASPQPTFVTHNGQIIRLQGKQRKLTRKKIEGGI